MADPYEEPEDETPAERRERLLNLTNPDWSSPRAKAKEPVVPVEDAKPKSKGRGVNAG